MAAVTQRWLAFVHWCRCRVAKPRPPTENLTATPILRRSSSTPVWVQPHVGSLERRQVRVPRHFVLAVPFRGPKKRGWCKERTAKNRKHLPREKKRGVVQRSGQTNDITFQHAAAAAAAVPSAPPPPQTGCSDSRCARTNRHSLAFTSRPCPDRIRYCDTSISVGS